MDTHVIGMNMQESNSVMSNEQLEPEVTLFVGYVAEKRAGAVFADLSKSYNEPPRIHARAREKHLYTLQREMISLGSLRR